MLPQHTHARWHVNTHHDVHMLVVYVNDVDVDEGETEGDVVGEWWMER